MSGAKKTRKPRALPPLTGVAQQVLAHLLNSIVLGNYPDAGSVEQIAEELGKSAAGIRRAVNTLVDKGYASVQGQTVETVYPTIAALRQQDPSLSEPAAKKILTRIKR